MAGFNGGMNQTFHMEIYDENLDKLIANISALNSPTFLYKDNLDRLAFRVIIYSSNPKGKSYSNSFLAFLNKSSSIGSQGNFNLLRIQKLPDSHLYMCNSEILQNHANLKRGPIVTYIFINYQFK